MEKERQSCEGGEQKTRVVFVHQSAELYGSDKILLTLVGALDRTRYDPVVLLPRVGPLFHRLVEVGVQTHIVPLALVGSTGKLATVLKLPFQLWRANRAMDRVLGNTRVDFVHANTLAVLSGAVWAWQQGIKHVWHVHEIIERPRYAQNVFAFVLKTLSWRIVCNSEATRRWMVRTDPKLTTKSLVIRNAVDVKAIDPRRNQQEGARRERLGLSAEDLLVVLVGRINSRKGHHLLIEAAELLKDRGWKNVRYLMVGSPPRSKEHLRDRLLNRIACSAVCDDVRLVDFMTDIKTVWDVCDVAVIPSTEPESFGLVALEAMAARRPVVAAGHGGICEVIVDRETGLLFEPGSKEALADTLERVFADERYREELGDRGYQRVLSYFSIREFTCSFEQLYSSRNLRKDGVGH